MAKKVIKFSLSASSVNDAIKELESYKQDLERKCNELTEKLAEKGVEIARAQIISLDAVFNGDLLASIHSESRESNIWAVVADDESAAFVEFGTGTVGAASPYTGQLPEGVSWAYASGKKIRQFANGKVGWIYPGDDGNYYFTEGMPSRPFMYNTANELQEKVVDVAREVFGNG